MCPVNGTRLAYPDKDPITKHLSRTTGGYLDMELLVVLCLDTRFRVLVALAYTWDEAAALLDRAAIDRQLSPFAFSIRSVKVGEIIPA